MNHRPTTASKICLSPNATAPSTNKISGVRTAGKKDEHYLRVPPDKTYCACKPPDGQCDAHARVGNMHFIIIVKITTAMAVAVAQHANFLHANGLRERPVPGVVWYISLLCPRSCALCTATRIYTTTVTACVFYAGYRWPCSGSTALELISEFLERAQSSKDIDALHLRIRLAKTQNKSTTSQYISVTNAV